MLFFLVGSNNQLKIQTVFGPLEFDESSLLRLSRHWFGAHCFVPPRLISILGINVTGPFVMISSTLTKSSVKKVN